QTGCDGASGPGMVLQAGGREGQSIDQAINRIEMANMTILITTPTGNIGRRVLRELLAPEFSVRVIARDPARLPEEVREQVEVIRGSGDDSATLRLALDGVEA